MKNVLQLSIKCFPWKVKLIRAIFLLTALLVVENLFSQIKNYATDPNISVGVKAFLTKLNSGGTPLENMSPADARKVLDVLKNPLVLIYLGLKFQKR